MKTKTFKILLTFIIIVIVVAAVADSVLVVKVLNKKAKANVAATPTTSTDSGVQDNTDLEAPAESSTSTTSTDPAPSTTTPATPTTKANPSSPSTTPTPTTPSTTPTQSVPALPPVINSVTTTQKIVALTFDDGPGGFPPDTPTNTTEIVCNTLKSKGAKATFFFIGYKISPNLADANKVDAACGERANHSWSHTNLSAATSATINSEISKVNDLFVSTWGAKPSWFRPMGGIYNDTVRQAAKDNGQRIVIWNVKSHDYRDSLDIANNYWYPADKIKNDILNNVTPGSIILLHSVYKYTPDALPAILDGLKAKGYTVTTVTNLMNTGGAVKGVQTSNIVSKKGRDALYLAAFFGGLVLFSFLAALSIKLLKKS